MGLCPYRAALLPSVLLFLLMLTDPALPAGRPPPVVLGKARVQSWVRLFVRPAGWGSGEAVFQFCICSKHGIGEDMTVLSPGSVRPLPALLGAGVVKLLSPSTVEYRDKWDGYRAFVRQFSRYSQTCQPQTSPF